MPRGGRQPGAGRPKGSPSKISKTIRELMEAETGGVPVPVLLLRHGLEYQRQGLVADSIQAIGKAIEYGYPKLKHVEVQSEKDTTPRVEIVGIET